MKQHYEKSIKERSKNSPKPQHRPILSALHLDDECIADETPINLEMPHQPIEQSAMSSNQLEFVATLGGQPLSLQDN